MSTQDDLKANAKKMKDEEMMGCGDGFVKASAEIVKARTENLKNIDPKILKEKAEQLRINEMLGCGDGFTSGAK